MKSALLALFPCLLAVTVLAADPASRSDQSGIRAAALDYIEGWYSRDAARMERALHPALVKRRMAQDANGRGMLDDGGAQRLIDATRPRPGEATVPVGNKRRDVTILDIHGNAASVKIFADQWVDYLHLIKWEGEWKIVNVLWELHPPAP